MYEFNSVARCATALVVAIVPIRLAYMWLLPKAIPGIPHNPITSIWGDIPKIVRETKDKIFEEYIADEARKHGSLFQIFLGRRPMIVISDRTEVERIMLRGKNIAQSTRTCEMFGTVIPTGQIALPTNETWKRHRRLTGPSMSKRYLGRMSVRVAAGARNLVRLWGAKKDLVKDRGFNADLDLQLATLDTIVNITMGTLAGCIDAAYASLPANLSSGDASSRVAHLPSPPTQPLHSALRAMMASIEQASQSAYPYFTSRLIWITPTWRKHYKLFNNYVDNGITEARKKEIEARGLATDADCVVDMVVQREEREGAEKVGRVEMVDELMTYVVAGQDTTASALAWYVKYLPQDPEIQRRLHDEVCAVFGQDGELDFEAIDDSERVPILEAVVAETLRCAKLAAQTGRELIDDEVILGKVIPKGTQILFLWGVMSSEESAWGPDASKWNPRRWLNPDGSFNRAAGPMMAFGLGQRSCFGQKLAILQLKMFAAALSRVFIFKNVPKEVDSWEAMEFVTRQPKMCYVSLESWDQEKELVV